MGKDERVYMLDGRLVGLDEVFKRDEGKEREKRIAKGT